MITGIEVPLELTALLCAACAAAGTWGGRFRAKRRLDTRRDPLRDLMKPDVLDDAVDLAIRRNALREGSHAMLHGRIDQLAALRATWNPDIRNQVQQHIAAVMRAGLRRGDRIAMGADGWGDERFTILIPGADERAAVRIADRLRRSLAKLNLPQLGGAVRLTASFGVAADRFGENSEGLNQRARRALDAADADHVVPASEIEEVILLPAPASAPAPAVSAA